MRFSRCLAAAALTVAGLGIFSAPPARAASPGPLLWIDDANGNIGTVDVHTGAATLIGSEGGPILTDIAFDPSGNLWGIDYDVLYKVNKTTGRATEVGLTDIQDGNALVFGANGTLYAAGDGSTDLYTVNTTTGRGTEIGNIGFESAGDLAFNDGQLYLSDTNNELVKITLGPSFSAKEIGPLGFTNVYGLATGNDGVLYGVAGTDIFSVNTATGQGTLTADYGGQGLADAYGTAFVDETQSGSAPPSPSPVPLPSAAFSALAMLGLIGLVGAIRARKHAA